MRRNTIIIAEAGVNHNGSLDMAKKLIDAAESAGADYVKFQTFKSEKLVTHNAKKAAYQERNLENSDDSQFSMLKKLELSEGQHEALLAYCDTKRIHFFSTAFDLEGLDYLHGLGIDRFKIPSGEITNYPYLSKIAGFNKPVILSTGMATMNEIGEAIKILTSKGLERSDLTVLHCNTEYPTPMSDVNLHAMNSISKEFDVEIGYSDHTMGIEVPIAAVALGASVIEKHFTLNRELPGPDHKASLEPLELYEMVKTIRNIEEAVSGDGRKKPSKSEVKNLVAARRSIFTRRRLKKDAVIAENDLIALRPGDGISPMKWSELLGKRVSRNLPETHKISPEDFYG